MSEMLERVARALYEANLAQREMYAGAPAWEELEHKGFYLALARAAIEAMRLPTEAVLAAVVPSPEHMRDEHASDPLWAVWMQAAVMAERMALRQRWIDLIDAALSEPPAPEREPDHA